MVAHPHTHVAVQVGRARPAPWGALAKQAWPFIPACILADPSCTLTGAGIQELTVRRGARPRNPARKPWPHAHLQKQPSTLTEPRAPPRKQPCTTLSHCEHTSNPAGTIHPACTPTETAVHTQRLLAARSLTPHVHAACTLSAPPALTAHTATHALQGAPRLPSRSAEPRPPASGHELPPRLLLRPHPSGALRHLAWRRPQPILGARKGGARSPRGRICSRAAGRPPFKASRLPSPPPSRRGLGPHPGDCAGAWGLHMPGRSAGHWSKSLRAAWASGAAEPGAPAGRARTGRRARWLRAAPGRARGGRGGTPRPGPGRAAEAEAEGGESLLLAAWSGRCVPSPGPLPPRWRRAAARGAGVPELGPPVTPAREKQGLEALAASACSGRRAAGEGEINNARKRKTDVSRARARPPPSRGCAPARAPRCRSCRQRRCSDSSSPSSEAIVYWALNNLFIHPRGRGLQLPRVLLLACRLPRQVSPRGREGGKD